MTSLADDGEIERLEADAKAERIRFHREKVRNGPVKFTTFTNGQVRRTLQREDETRRRKLNKRHRRDWMAKRAELATLRGHLVIMGVLECRDETTEFAPHIRQESAVWLVRKFGPRDENGELVKGDTLVVDAVAKARQAFIEASA
jgi:hypothetical protein